MEMIDYSSMTEGSAKLFERALRVIPGGVTRTFRFFKPHPLYVKRAKGCRVWDVDGNEYIDFWMGHSALVLGHMHPCVVEAVLKQLEEGFHFGFCHEWEVKLAEEIVKLVPSAEMVRFTNSGTEANMHAVRLARAYTGRSKIGKFIGGWHGIYDPLDIAVTWPVNEPESAGLPEETFKNTALMKFNDLDSVWEAAKGEDLACIIVEPVLASAGVIPPKAEFLKGLREICDRTGTLLIFDEVITGFRLAPGGAQEYYGVTPDLTTLGKAVGGGEFAIGAFCGRRDVMELMDQRKFKDKSKLVKQGGTYSGNPLAMRAGYNALREYSKLSYESLNKECERVASELRSLIEDSGLNACVTSVGSMFKIHFVKEEPLDYESAWRGRNSKLEEEYFHFMVRNGVLLMSERNTKFYSSFAHGEEEYERIISLTREFLKLVKRGELK